MYDLLYSKSKVKRQKQKLIQSPFFIHIFLFFLFPSFALCASSLRRPALGGIRQQFYSTPY